MNLESIFDTYQKMMDDIHNLAKLCIKNKKAENICNYFEELTTTVNDYTIESKFLSNYICYSKL